MISRARSVHELKTWPIYFAPVLAGLKTWEFRKDDRAFRIDDELLLQEYAPKFKATDEAHYTGREVRVRVVYIARGGLIPEGYCVMSITICPISTIPPDFDTTDGHA